MHPIKANLMNNGNSENEQPELPDFMKYPNDKQFVFHKISSRCSTLFDSYITALDRCTNEGVVNMMYALEGGYEGIMSMEADLIEKYLGVPIRCRDVTCNNKMEHLPTQGMKVWNLNGHIVATPDNYIVVDEEDYNKHTCEPTVKAALDEVLKKEQPFQELEDYAKIQAEVKKMVLEQMHTLKSTLSTVLSSLKQHGNHQTVLSQILIKNLDQFAGNVIDTVDSNVPLLEQNERLVAQMRHGDLLAQTMSVQHVAIGDFGNIPPDYYSREVQRIQDAINSVYLKDETTMSPVFFSDGTMKARISVHNSMAPHETINLHEKPGGLDINTWKFEPLKRLPHAMPGYVPENGGPPGLDSLPKTENLKKPDEITCQHHPRALPTSALWKYRRFLNSDSNPYKQPQNQSTDNQINKETLSSLIETFQNNIDENFCEKLFNQITEYASSMPGTSKQFPNWKTEIVVDHNQPSTSTAGPNTTSRAAPEESEKEEQRPPPRRNGRAPRRNGYTSVNIQKARNEPKDMQPQNKKR